LLVDERGVPLSVIVTAANRNDGELTAQVLAAAQWPTAAARPESPQLCVDGAYAAEKYQTLIRDAGYVPHLRKGLDAVAVLDPAKKPRRWVVEVSHSWFNRFRKLLVRYEKTTSSYLALCQLAASIIALRKVGFIYG